MMLSFYTPNLRIHKPKLIGWILGLIMLPSILHACSCGKVPNYFMRYISNCEFVAMVEVIGLLENGNEFEPGHSFTKVKIINQYAGEYIGKETYIINSTGIECYIGLTNAAIGDKYVVQGYYSEGKDYIEWYDCSYEYLKIENDRVLGNITRCRRCHWYKWTRFLKAISFGLIERDIHKYHPKPQRMKIENFVRLLNEELKRA